MSPLYRILLFIILPIIAVMSFPPDTIEAALPALPFVAGLFVLLGIFLFRGRSLALTLTIFLLGLNLIVRLMMFFPHARPVGGPTDIPYIITGLFSIALSFYLLLRLDQSDVRAQMVA